MITSTAEGAMALMEQGSSPQLAIAPEGDLAAEREDKGAAPESIGVALSGGGVRAALFSLGVLIGLVESGQHRKVSTISSVSGGSIVNGAVAQSCRYREMSPDDFETKVAKPVAEGLCGKGMFVFSRAGFGALFRAIAPRFGVVATVIVFSWNPVAAALDALAGRRETLPWEGIVVVAVAIALAAIFFLRGLLQQGLYASFLATVPRGKHRDLRELEDSPTTHVIVATDLVSAAPVFFSREFVYCPTFGWGVPGRTRTASAVYASAAFPVVFPARRFLRRPFRFQNGMSPPPYPRCLKLSDGGVYNNLGTDWFDELKNQCDKEIWQFGDLPLRRTLEPVTSRVVVNAGAASRRIRRVPPFLSISRTMNVLYDNTVRPRLQTMRGEHERGDLLTNVVIDISESPYHVARRLAELNTPDADQYKARARTVEQLLGQRGDTYWIEFARQTSTTKTKLTRAGLEPGARMMLHGYLSTVVTMHVLYGVELPKPLRDEGFFLDLAGRPSAGWVEEPIEAQETPTESGVIGAEEPVPNGVSAESAKQSA